MIAIDTNVLVQAFWGENSFQAEKADALLTDENIFIPISVILETEWVLRSRYKVPKARIIDTFHALMASENVEIGNEDALNNACSLCAFGLDFADALHLALSDKADKFMTFDRLFSKNTPSNHLPQVELI